MTGDPNLASTAGRPAATGTFVSRSAGTLLAPTVLGLILLVGTLGNLWWIWHNTILMGRDASGYLQTALDYRALLSPLTWQAIFEAFVYPPYRTPAIYIAAQPFLALKLPGGTMDAAQLLNVLLYGCCILIAYALARQVTGRVSSLFAAALVAFLPMMAAMARLFYTEAFLTASVALSLLALYKSKGFTSGKWSLVWGACAGLGLLVKWTFPIYVALPVLVVLWRERTAMWQRPEWRPRALLVGLACGVGFVLIWWRPNRPALAALPSGDWAALGWLCLITALVYALIVSRRRGRWFAAGLLLALSIASLWYLPHSDFWQALLATDVERGSDPRGALDWSSYRTYGEYWYRQHFGALLFWILIPAALCPWLWQLIRQRRSLNRAADLLWWSLLSATAVLIVLSQRNPRNLAPLLPQVAILIAIGISALPRLIRGVIMVASLVALLLQWGTITFDGWQPFSQRTAQAWVSHEYAMAPAAGVTDGGYAISPALLQEIADRTAPENIASLTLAINTEYLHRGSLRYLIEEAGYAIEVRDLTEASATWQGALGSQYLALKDGDNNNAEDQARAIMERIAAGDALFEALYTPLRSWTLPNGERVTLYQRPGPGFPEADAERFAKTQTLAEEIRAVASQESAILYGNPELAVWLGEFDPLQAARVAPDAWDINGSDLIAGLQGTVFAVLDSDSSALESYLDREMVRATDFGDGDPSVVVYGVPEELSERNVLATELAWPAAGVTLDHVTGPARVERGGVLELRLASAGATGAGQKYSLRLESESGSVVAANDRPVVDDDRFGLFVPATADVGNYRLVARLYDEATLLPVTAADGSEDLYLATIEVE